MIDIEFIETLVDMDNDRAALYIQWDATEIIQENMPYLEIGWHGFVPLVIFRSIA